MSEENIDESSLKLLATLPTTFPEEQEQSSKNASSS